MPTPTQSRRNMQHATSHAISNVNNKPHSTRALTIPESPQFGTTHAKARGQSREPSNHRSVTREEVNAYARDFRKNNTSDAAREAQAFRSRNGPTVAVGPSFVTEARAEAHVSPSPPRTACATCAAPHKHHRAHVVVHLSRPRSTLTALPTLATTLATVAMFFISRHRAHSAVRASSR